MNLLPDRINTSIAQTLLSFSTTSKIIISTFALIMGVSAFTLLYQVNEHFLVNVPAHGGTINEGIIGTPRLLNPILTQNDAGKDITSFIYSGLLVKTPNGIENDLAEKYTVSDNSLVYTFTLKKGLTFHDGMPLTSKDVAFTIAAIQDPQIHSPRRTHFSQIKVETPNDQTIVFTLPHTSNTFLEDITVGILPEHIWKSVKADEFSIIEYNSEPVAAGPYKISSVSRGKGGLPTAYNLIPFSGYMGNGSPLVSHVNFLFYQDEVTAIKALQAGDINSLGGISAQNAALLQKDGFTMVSHNLPRVFGLFFNQNKNPVLAYPEVRKVLNATAPRQEIVDTIFKGFARTIVSPFSNETASDTIDIAAATATLEKAGWKLNADGVRVKTLSKDGKSTQELSFSIATGDAEDLKNTANALKTAWEKLGFKVQVDIFESGELNQSIIRDRKYDALLFGQVITQNSDYAAFWRSSERKDPGLNVAMYVNTKADTLLDKLSQTDGTDTQATLLGLNTEFTKDLPAVMIYSPVYTHVIPQELSEYYGGPLKESSERFINKTFWYMRTERVWPIFAQHKKLLEPIIYQ